MTTTLNSRPVTAANSETSTKSPPLARLAQLRSDLQERELALDEARTELLLAYREARREGFSDGELSDIAATQKLVPA